MSFHSPQTIAELAAESGLMKAKLPLSSVMILGFLGGAFISLGFLLDIRVIAAMPPSWGTFAGFIGACVFPIGLILIILAGGELVTGNMLTLPIAWFRKKIQFSDILKNWVLVTVSNFAGALFVAYFFGHVVGLTENGLFLAKTVSIAQAKLHDSFTQSFISAIGCNWLVCLAVWLALGSQEFTGKILAIWFPVMAFVAIGFQHVVANMFVIPAAIFAGQITWNAYLPNFLSVFLGNMVGGAVFVALGYFLAYRRNFPDQVLNQKWKKSA